jgi:serine/threonine protein phosphatase PrpC
MTRELEVSIGQYSDRGRKETNQDFHGALIPEPPALALKGITLALADGISSSAVSRVASETAVKSLLTDYYCTSDTWSVKTSAQRVIAAANSWLHAQTRRSHVGDRDRGYVCTLSVIILKSATAHLFHVGDARIYRLSGGGLEQLTEDHRVVISSQESFLGRALGANPQIEIDYRTVPLERGDVLIMATDGVYEHVTDAFMAATAAAPASASAHDLDDAAEAIAREALRNGSPDNLTVQIVRIDQLPEGDVDEVLGTSRDLPLPPLLEPRTTFDGYAIVREIHASSRSHIYLAVDTESQATVAIKIPSLDMRGDPAPLKRLMMEEWVARRLDNVHVLRAPPPRKHNYLYAVFEHVEGTTLAQWMIDNPRPGLEAVRSIVEQIAKGLQAFHRKEMLHQDLRPQNVLIDRTGTVKIVDFGSVRVPGVLEAAPSLQDGHILGTVQYTAPEYFLGQAGSARSDLFSLGVIAYQMLTGGLPYGAQVAQVRRPAQLRKLTYRSAATLNPAIPDWVDRALEKAVHLDPYKRHEALSEFLFDLRHPRETFLELSRAPLLQRNPHLFWQGLSFVLACAALGLLAFPIR